jgi:hypothetical protein
MKKHKPFNNRGHINIMKNNNVFSKIDNFIELTTDKNAMMVFLTVAKKRIIKIEDISEETNLGLREVVNSTDKLEKEDFIVHNPNPISQKFKLGFNGQIFAEQLKIEYPEIEKVLGKKSLIEPL